MKTEIWLRLFSVMPWRHGVGLIFTRRTRRKRGDVQRMAGEPESCEGEPRERADAIEAAWNRFGALRELAQARLTELCERFPLGYTPQVVWRGYRVSAGLAYYKTGVIGLSAKVLRDEKSVVDTLDHEYAHLLAVARHGLRAAGHGAGWQRAMLDIGHEPKVRHNYEVERNVARQSVTYICARCGRSFVRARRLPRRRRYLHAGCGGQLRLARVERITGDASGS